MIQDREETVAREKEAPKSHQGYGAFGWQNDTIESYLGASIACADANDYQDPLEPSWASFADFLYGGKIYE